MMTMHQYQSYQGFTELRQGMADFFYENNYGVTLNSVTEILPLMGQRRDYAYFDGFE
jgi:aspartate/methionine/tyrosine aminotransferase